MFTGYMQLKHNKADRLTAAGCVFYQLNYFISRLYSTWAISALDAVAVGEFPPLPFFPAFTM